MSAHNQKSAFSSYYHDTWTLLKNYRSVSWSIEVSDYNLQAEFRTEYGCASEAVLDGLEASNSNTHLESYVHSLERSKRMLQLINSAIDLMRKQHEKGERYYWILYYTYLAPHHYANNYEILHFLELKGMPIVLALIGPAQCLKAAAIIVPILRLTSRPLIASRSEFSFRSEIVTCSKMG